MHCSSSKVPHVTFSTWVILLLQEWNECPHDKALSALQIIHVEGTFSCSHAWSLLQVAFIRLNDDMIVDGGVGDFEIFVDATSRHVVYSMYEYRWTLPIKCSSNTLTKWCSWVTVAFTMYEPIGFGGTMLKIIVFVTNVIEPMHFLCTQHESNSDWMHRSITPSIHDHVSPRTSNTIAIPFSYRS